MDIHIIIIIIGRESNSSFLPDSQIYLCIISCISGHLTEPLPFGDVPEDSLPITSWISRRFSAIKGMTSQEARRIVVPHC